MNSYFTCLILLACVGLVGCPKAEVVEVPAHRAPPGTLEFLILANPTDDKLAMTGIADHVQLAKKDGKVAKAFADAAAANQAPPLPWKSRWRWVKIRPGFRLDEWSEESLAEFRKQVMESEAGALSDGIDKPLLFGRKSSTPDEVDYFALCRSEIDPDTATAISVTEKDVLHIKLSKDQNDRAALDIQLTEDGGKKMRQLTSMNRSTDNQKRRGVILVQGELSNDPMILSPIRRDLQLSLGNDDIEKLIRLFGGQ